jgi:4-hydroxy-3-methylbut-2-enyl diphosphate reductase
MEMILAKTAGFCFGVKRAVALAFDAPRIKNTYTLGPIIHNDAVIKKLEEERGIQAINRIEKEVVQQLIIRSHGVGPMIYDEVKAAEIALIDATCPYVKKIHKLVRDYSQKGYAILIIGDETHPEIIGIKEWAGKAHQIIKDLPHFLEVGLEKNKRYLVVAQTTYKKEIVHEIVQMLQQQAYEFEFKDTICQATRERQDEAAQLAAGVGIMLVIGSPFSSNTQKLFEICKSICKQTYCIEDEKSIRKEWFYENAKVGITAGASTPSDSIEAVIKKLKEMEDGFESKGGDYGLHSI